MRKFLFGVGVIAVIIILSALGTKYFRQSIFVVDENAGGVNLGQGTGNPEGWPEDAPNPYLDAPILYSHEDDGLGAVYNVGVPREEVVAYYVAELEARGWTVSVPNLPGDTVVIRAEKDFRRFDVYLIAADDVTAVTTGILFNENEE